MKSFLLLSFITLCLSCGDVKTETQLTITKPLPSPTSLEAAKAMLQQGNYLTEDIGLVRTFMDEEDGPIWSANVNDTTAFFRDFLKARKTFALNFLTDSTVALKDDQVKLTANYRLEADTAKAVKLELAYADPEFSFGDATEQVTHTYLIKGIDKDRLLLETPRTFNERKVVLMMKRK